MSAKCTTKEMCIRDRRKHVCTKKVEKKDWIEELVTRFTVQEVLTDENIDRIATKAMEIIEKESADTTYLEGLQNELKDCLLYTSHIPLT